MPRSPIHRTRVAVREIAGTTFVSRPAPVAISGQELGDMLRSLKQASASFVASAEEQAATHARKAGKTPDPSAAQKIEAVSPHRDFGRIKGNIRDDAAAIAMIDHALRSDRHEIPLFCTGFPMKVFNPLETEYQGDLVDLGDVSALLRFAELAEVLTHFGSAIGKRFSVVVVSDGRMNAGMFKVDPLICDSYVRKLDAMIGVLGISQFVSVREFSSLLAPHDRLREGYDNAVRETKAGYHAAFDSLLDPEDLEGSIRSALKREQSEYHTSSFDQIFDSTVGSVRYAGIEKLSAAFDTDFLKTYALILESILWGRAIERTAFYTDLSAGIPAPSRAGFFEALRHERLVTMHEAWQGTIEYIAVLAAHKKTKVLDALFPDGIRITTRPKEGQIGVHTSDQNCPELFSYHSVPVILPCSRSKNVKVDFQLRSDALKIGYHPVVLDGDVFCYEHPQVSSLPIGRLPWVRGSNRNRKAHATRPDV